MQNTMRDLVRDFYLQVETAEKTEFFFPEGFEVSGINKVLACGLGGSGIGARLVASMVAADLKMPFEVCHDYDIPAYTDSGTLVLISSYSGNTEETIDAMYKAMAAGAKLVCITSGGAVADFARKYNLALALMPAGFPPRSQMGVSVSLQVKMLTAVGLIGTEHLTGLRLGALFIHDNQESIKAKAGELADFFKGRVPLIYADAHREPVLIRWQQQLNENSKVLCHHHVFPEMNHNELVGWEGGDNRFAALLMRTAQDHKRTSYRMDICAPLFRAKCDRVEEVLFDHSNSWVNALHMIHLGDWISVFLADLNQVDATEIKTIIYLKDQLGRLK